MSISKNRYSSLFTREDSKIVLSGTFKNYAVADLSDTLPLLSYLIITHSRNTVLKDIYSWFINGIDFRNYGSLDEGTYIT